MDNLEEIIPEAPVMDNPLTENPDPVAKRHAEQLAGSKAEADKYRAIAVESLAKASEKSADAFLEAHSKDPKLANEVAKKLGYANADEVLAQLNQKPEKEEDDFDTKYNQRRAKEDHEKAITKAEKILAKLPADLREEAQKRFDKVSKGQLLDEDTAIEFAEMATLYVNKDNLKANIYNDSLAMLGSTGVGSSKKSTDSAPQYVIRNGELVSISNN